jgi:hypothetical protein
MNGSNGSDKMSEEDADDASGRLGTCSQAQLLAIKKTLTLQLRQAMKRASFAQRRLAKEMRTSRTVINRMLDPSDSGVTLATPTRASQMLRLLVDTRLRPTRRSAA